MNFLIFLSKLLLVLLLKVFYPIAVQFLLIGQPTVVALLFLESSSEFLTHFCL